MMKIDVKPQKRKKSDSYKSQLDVLTYNKKYRWSPENHPHYTIIKCSIIEIELLYHGQNEQSGLKALKEQKVDMLSFPIKPPGDYLSVSKLINW